MKWRPRLGKCLYKHCDLFDILQWKHINLLGTKIHQSGCVNFFYVASRHYISNWFEILGTRGFIVCSKVLATYLLTLELLLFEDRSSAFQNQCEVLGLLQWFFRHICKIVEVTVNFIMSAGCPSFCQHRTAWLLLDRFS